VRRASEPKARLETEVEKQMHHQLMWDERRQSFLSVSMMICAFYELAA
jgi:hypothetical protein